MSVFRQDCTSTGLCRAFNLGTAKPWVVYHNITHDVGCTLYSQKHKSNNKLHFLNAIKFVTKLYYKIKVSFAIQ